MMRRLLFVLALSLAAPAWAQGTEDEPQAAPGSIAIGMIEEANADGVFEIVHNGQVSVRHTASGMRCDFARNGDGGRLVLFPNLPRGDDVACDWNDGQTFTTLYATRYPFNSTLAEQIDGAAAAIRRHFPNAETYPGDVEQNTDDGLPTRRTTRFIVMREGQRYYSRVSVARVGSWIVKLRYSAPAPDAAAAADADRMGDGLMDGALQEMLAPHP